ncbi:MAG: bifunctional demethylmenaquinone methyltransferase/2-methoxy-6-polyprenyl-1,4-benzoquinol methylase UbiE [Nitrospirota bacterium]
MPIVDYKKRETIEVKQMFSSISNRYDLLNHVLSFCLDFRWRKKVAMETNKVNCQRILDVCTGTGDMAIELCKYWKGRAHINGIDFSRELIEIGKKKSINADLNSKITFSEADAENLPFKDRQFDAVTITFGLRNIKNRLKALEEFYRVTKPGGCFVCLEFSQPENKIFKRLYSFYLIKLVPLISLFFGSSPEAYRYLGNTIKDFPSPSELKILIKSAGWKDVSHYYLAGGIVSIHNGKKL